ncbi:hypothetical protein Tco_0729672 [Tanacetum coccineum]|uniref:Zinc finger, CCHC-type n=1 Tax=Tanacetum coccineum TaxID=301880 RepID=A0ABQ4YQQ7_9ASTR
MYSADQVYTSISALTMIASSGRSLTRTGGNIIGFPYLELPRAGVVVANVTDVPGSFDEDGAVPHRARGALMVGREVGDLASNGHYRMDLFADGHSSVPTGRIPPFSGILFLETLCSRQQKFLVLRFFDVKEQQGIDRLNIEKLDGNIVQKHGGSKQVGFKQLGPGVETGVHGVHDEKRVWFEVELQGAQGDREAEVFQVSNDDTAVAQRRLEDKQPEEKTNTECLRSTQQCKKSGVAKHLGVAGLQQRNGLVKETNVTLLAKVVLYKNMGFNESGKYKKTFIGSGVGTGSMQVLQGDEFEVEPQDGHTFEVEPHGNVDYVVGSQEYREDNNEAAFAVAAVDKIYVHESLTFNNTVACEVISKWKVGLKDDMDARLDMYVLSNGCKKCSDDNDGYYWESTLGMVIHLFLYIDGMVFSSGCLSLLYNIPIELFDV